MVSTGIKHAKLLIMLGLAGAFAGSLLDFYFKMFPLFTGAGLLSFELISYFYLRVKYRYQLDKL